MYLLCWIGRRNKEHWRIFETLEQMQEFVLNPRNCVRYDNGMTDSRTIALRYTKDSILQWN